MPISVLLVLMLGVLLGFYVQSVAGFGSALVALPVILTVLNIQEAVALLSLFFFVFSLVQISKNWRQASRKTGIELLAGIVFGLALGIAVLKFGKPLLLKKALGVFVLLYVGYSFISMKRVAVFNKLGLLFGFGSGFFSGLFSTGGPMCVIYVYNKLDKPEMIRATLIVALGITDILRLPVLLFSGILTERIALAALYAAPVFLLALFLGQKTYRRIREDVFKKVLMGLLLLSGIFLVVR